MTRPAVSVVMPFAGTAEEARAAVAALLRLHRREGDALIVADNAGTVSPAPGVTVVRAVAERSPAHARNVGAAHANGDWILFLDADCTPGDDLLDAYFATPIEPGVGALAGEVSPAEGARTLAARYGAARNFLSQEKHLANPFRPRAAAANLMVRRSAFEQVGGFYEGLRAAEDTDFCWRLQEAGWRLELRADARVEHRYRATVPELRRQWRGYAAGRAWLARRYDGFEPRPAVLRAARRAASGRGRPRGAPAAAGADSGRGRPRGAPPAGDALRGEVVQFLALDAVLGVEELVGFTQSNRPARRPSARPPADLVIVTDGSVGEVELASGSVRGSVRVEAARRPERAPPPAPEPVVDYREDDGLAARAAALARLMASHPVRCAVDVLRRRPGDPRLLAIAPAAQRLARDAGARVMPVGGDGAQRTARRLHALGGRRAPG